jgi:DHA2 family multidrug resistance protein
MTNTALGTLSPERMKNASGLFNLMRNLGGAIGLAAINTVLNSRTDLHVARLHEAVNWAREPATETLSHLTERFSRLRRAPDGAQQMTAMAHRQAVVMSFAGVFFMLTVLFVALAALGIIMKRPAPVAAGAGGH